MPAGGKRRETNPQFSISFLPESHQLNQQQHQLQIQIIRVHAIQKQRSIIEIWSMKQDQLCDYFTCYDLFPQEGISMQELLQSKKLKLIKSEGKVYFGTIEKKKRQGKGISTNRDGQVYQGDFNNNQKDGRGVQIYPNGNVYVGQFMNGKKHGKGKFYWFNLSSQNPNEDISVQYYEGEWWGGLPDGQGMHQKLNGDLYIGNFKNGLKHSQGKQLYANGDYYKGEFVNGMPQGCGQYMWRKEGSYFKGDFKQGLRSGYGVWHKGGNSSQQYQGHYYMDKKSGYGIYFWDNGWTYKGNFDNDYRNGYGELYDSQNKLMYRGFWENGQQTEKEHVMSQREKQINFRSVQLGKNHTKSSFTQRDPDFREKRARSNSRFWDFKQDGPDLVAISRAVDFNSKKRPLSHHSIKNRKASNDPTRRYTKLHDPSKTGSTVVSRKCVGSIKSNLFVPFRHLN